MNRLRHLVLALCGLGLAACASVAPQPAPPHEGEASYRMRSDPATRHYKLPLGSTATGAGLLAHPAPVYPAALLPACPPPVELAAKLIVDTAGRVSEVRFPATSKADPAYLAAVRTAAQAWRFEPLLFQHWAADADGNSHVVDRATKPFSLDYVFRFACHDGQPQTGASAS